LIARKFHQDADNDASDLLVDILSHLLTDDQAIRCFLKHLHDCAHEISQSEAPLGDVFRTLTILLYGDSTGAAQKAAKCCKQFIATSSTVSIADGLATQKFEESGLAHLAAEIKSSLLMPGISNVQNTVALVRFFELSVQISLLS
jgi:hypothetical protein